MNHPSASSQTTYPLRWSYALGWGLMAVGMIALIVSVSQVALTSYRGIKKISLPGAKVLTLKEPGIYVGVYQHSTGNPVPAEELARLEIQLSESSNGFPVPLARLPGAQVFSVGGQVGAVLFQTEISEPGDYFLSAVYPQGAPGPAIEGLLIHESVQSNRADLVVGIIVCLILNGFGIFTLIKTSNLAKKLQGPTPAKNIPGKRPTTPPPGKKK